MVKIYLLKQSYFSKVDYDDYGDVIIGAFTSEEALKNYVETKVKFTSDQEKDMFLANAMTDQRGSSVVTNLLPPGTIDRNDNYTFTINYECVFVIK